MTTGMHLAVRLETPLSGHLLVEHHEVVRPTPKHLDGVVGILGPVDFVALVAQEDAVRLQQLRFIVDPEHGFRWLGHGIECRGRN